MNDFVLTKFMFPLESKMSLSNDLGFYFDNPRTKDEISFVKKHLKKALYKKIDSSLVKDSINKYIRNINSSYIEKIFNDFDASGFDWLDVLSRIFIIVRFKEKDLTKERFSNINDTVRFIDITATNYDILLDFSYFISFIFDLKFTWYKGSQYFDINFLLEPINYHFDLIFEDNYFYKINNFVCQWIVVCSKLRDADFAGLKYFPLWNEINDNIRKNIYYIDKIFKEKEDEIIYIGSILKFLFKDHEGDDIKFKFVSLIGILELLLTHKPNQKNKSDSLTKQFHDKMSEIILRYEDSIDILKIIKKKLIFIYDLRSKIAHGEYKKIVNIYNDKDFKNIYKQDFDNNNYIDKGDKDCELRYVFNDTLKYLRYVLSEYIKNPEYIKNLKDKEIVQERFIKKYFLSLVKSISFSK